MRDVYPPPPFLFFGGGSTSLFYFTHIQPYVSFFMYMIYAIIKLILIDFILGEGYG